MEKNIEWEKDSVDNLTDIMFSLDFLRHISRDIFDINKNKVTLEEFYNNWLSSTEALEQKIPYSIGVILGYLYVGILFTKESWYDYIPNVSFKDADKEFGIITTKYTIPKKPNPNLQYVIRRLRNSLGHGNIHVNVPNNIPSIEKIEEYTTVTFYDVNNRDNGDTFEIELTLLQLQKFVRKFHSIIHTQVRIK